MVNDDTPTLDELRAVAFRELQAKRGGPAQTDPTLPDCPLCGATALAFMPEIESERVKHGGRWQLRFLAHDCDCAFDDPDRYDVGVHRLHRESEAVHTFLASLPARYRRMLEHPLDPKGAMRAAIEAAKGLEGGSFFYLYGSPGTGKTHLAIRTATRHIGTGTGAFWTAAGALDAIKRSYGVDGLEPPDLTKPTALVLDDLGKERPTVWAAEQLYNAIDQRYTDARTTIVTSNFPPEVVAERLFPEPKDEPTAKAFMSRLASGRVVRIDGDDHRTEHHS